MVSGNDFAIPDYRGGIIVLFSNRKRVACHHGDAMHFMRQILQGFLASAIKALAQQQVFRWITGKAQFRRHHQARFPGFGPIGEVQDFRSVAGKIADRSIDLGDRYFHRINITFFACATRTEPTQYQRAVKSFC